VANVYEAFSFNDRTVIGKVLADITIDFCKTMTGTPVSQTGMTMVALGVGKYVLMNPNVMERTVISGYLTTDSTKSFSVMMDPVDGDIAQETTLAASPGAMKNQVLDECVYDANGLMTAGVMYIYNSAANAVTHNKVTGLLKKYNVSSAYTGKLANLFKIVEG